MYVYVPRMLFLVVSVLLLSYAGVCLVVIYFMYALVYF